MLVSVSISRLFHGPGPDLMSFCMLRSNLPSSTEIKGHQKVKLYISGNCGANYFSLMIVHILRQQPRRRGLEMLRVADGGGESGLGLDSNQFYRQLNFANFFKINISVGRGGLANANAIWRRGSLNADICWGRG